MTRRWDIFCSVVDNFGDISVCWRLARQLASELGHTVRLWVDDLASFSRVCHAVDPALDAQRVAGVDIRRWSAACAPSEPGDFVVEGFGARLPDAFIGAMAARRPPPVWINLEYLSAEAWVEGCHGLPSPHPRLPLVKHFFFPGYTASTGGLLREKDLVAARDAFQCDAMAMAEFRRSLGLAPIDGNALCVSLFCYENAALAPLVRAWSADAQPLLCLVPEGKAQSQLERIAGTSLAAGSSVRLGQLTLHGLPFLELDAYDRLLWCCDLNFVRGEDSFVRAQFAARPLVWQAYPQEKGAHLPKIAAFLGRYTAGLDDASQTALSGFFQAWNQGHADVAAAWQALRSQQPALMAHAARWAGRLASGGSLAQELAEFCENRLE